MLSLERYETMRQVWLASRAAEREYYQEQTGTLGYAVLIDRTGTACAISRWLLTHPDYRDGYASIAKRVLPMHLDTMRSAMRMARAWNYHYPNVQKEAAKRAELQAKRSAGDA